MATTDARRTFSATQKREIYFRAGGRCSICRNPLGSNWEADHVEPHSRGGETHVDNGQALCGPCNRRKGGRPAGAWSPGGLPRRNGEWWSTREKRQERCPHCGEKCMDSVTVMGYLPELDPRGIEARHHGGWAPDNWLQSLECEHCGVHSYVRIYNSGRLAEIGRELKGWE